MHVHRSQKDFDDAFPSMMSKSPIINKTTWDVANRVNYFHSFPYKIVRYKVLQDAIPKEPDMVRAGREEAEAAVILPVMPDLTAQLPLSVVELILSYVGDNPNDLLSIGATNRAWERGTFSVVDTVCITPHCVSFEKAEDPKVLDSLFKYYVYQRRGQYVSKVTFVDNRELIHFPQSYKGPSVSTLSISRLINCFKYLNYLDIRGVFISDFIPCNDVFLSTLHLKVPALRVLKIGAQFIRNWQPLWWTRMPYLSEIVIGSRREDADWTAPSTPVTLHDDFFTMLRSPAHVWDSLKVWVPITELSFSALVLPSLPFLKLYNLCVNAIGNVHIKPLEDVSPQAEHYGREDKRKGTGEKGGKKHPSGQILQDQIHVSMGLFPVLLSFTVADVDARPEFSVELMSKLSHVAPALLHFNVANTHRASPTHIEPVVRGKRIRKIVKPESQ
eukprot:Tbor_TRINITY_DN4220_c1_g1::TRINITY_DN4220_c1_g1_i1::g.24006::m.24006